MSRFSAVLAVATIVLAIAASGCASVPFLSGGDTGSAGPATVTGQVTSDSGAVLADVAVRLSGSSFRRSARTNIAGRFTFDRVPLGTYTLSASAVGYKGAKQQVVVDKEGTVALAVKLRM